MGNTYQERPYGNRDNLPTTGVGLPNRHGALLAPVPMASKQHHTKRSGLEEGRERLAEEEVAEDFVWVFGVLQAVELRDEDSDDRQRDRGAEVA